MIHIEYAHITPNLNPNDIIASVNSSKELITYFASKDRVSLGMLVDDLYDTSINAWTVQSWIDQLEIKPDNVYSEKSFSTIAEKILKKIDKNNASFRENSKGIWLQVSTKRYASEMEFILCRYLPSGIEYSCPILAAATYLWRLGYFPEEEIFFYSWTFEKKADRIVNFLDPYFLDVESQIRKIIELTYPDALDKITWIFHNQN